MTSLRSALGGLLSAVVDPTIVFSFSHPGFLVHSLGFEPGDLDVDMSGKRCLITGANQGLGLAAARGLAALGAEVTLLCRNRERGEEAARSLRQECANDRVSCVPLDVSNLQEIRELASSLDRAPIDVLIHNAGLLPDQRQLTTEGLELTFATHVVGPHLLTKSLCPAFTAAARVVWVSSGGMYSQKLSLDDYNWQTRAYDGVLAYAQTKRMQVVLSELWAEKLGPCGVQVSCMHPGWADTQGVRTSIPRFHRLTRSILRSVEEGADTIVWLAASPAAARAGGGFYLDRRPRSTHYLPGTRETEDERTRLWDLCEELTQ